MARKVTGIQINRGLTAEQTRRLTIIQRRFNRKLEDFKELAAEVGMATTNYDFEDLRELSEELGCLKADIDDLTNPDEETW